MAGSVIGAITLIVIITTIILHSRKQKRCGTVSSTDLLLICKIIFLKSLNPFTLICMYSDMYRSFLLWNDSTFSLFTVFIFSNFRKAAQSEDVMTSEAF